MCPPKQTQQKIEPAAQAPPPAQAAASANQSGPRTPNEVSPQKTKRKGASSLRIPLNANTGSNASGVNVPRA